jgi:glycosyltransferase involved in cell wall biosynthesis
MGIAQGMGILLDLAECLLDRPDVGFLFVGRGSNVASLRAEADRRVLDNTLFFDEIDPDEIPGLYSQCHIGLVALDPRHRTHNIPGKFLSYMQAGLPVVASINQGNDLVGLIQSQQVGYVCTDGTLEGLDAATRRLLADIESDGHFAVRCRSLSERMFSAEGAARQIVAALQA